MEQERIYNYLTGFTEKLQSEGRYAFTLSEVKKTFELSEDAIKLALSRLVRKRRIISVRRSFYVIVPPEYSEMGILPPPLFIEELMAFLAKPYYVGLLSAAALHGAGHQQPQEFYVVTVKPTMRQTICKDVRINFSVKSNMPEFGVEELKTDTGMIKVSSPELTALDLIQFENSIGGLNRVVTLLDELAEKLDPIKLQTFVANNNTGTAYLQRLGFILEKILDFKDPAQIIYDNLQTRNCFRIPLKPGAPKTGFPMDKRWKVFENITLESDL